jgi:hypothetical protein
MDGARKPKLAFFACKHEHLSEFVMRHKEEHVKCLSEFFDVTVIAEDCDYQQICFKYQPDLTLVESAVYFSSCRRPKVKNARAYPQIPKIGFLHADAFSEGRAGFLSDVDHWGIETFFTIATAAAEYTPEISENLFVWPNFVDADVYHDYGQSKNIPVLFTGNTNALYPWRQKIIKRVSKYYPSLTCPHPGYGPTKIAAQAIAGESYARMLNASWFVPACGTIAKEIVRKHLEVPACKACLISEQSAALEAAGFADMRNCVFADEHDVVDKLKYLFGNPDLLNSIIEAGHQLVHSRHTLKHRDQIFQWFQLNKRLQASQKIVQTGPFEPLRIVDKSRGPANSHIICHGLHLALLRQGDEELWAGKYGEAETLYLKCLNYYRYMPEPQLRLALCNLYKGNARLALSWVLKPIQFTLAEYKANDPDPVEWAYFIISLLCAGKVDDAVTRADQFACLHHPELDRARWVTNFLKNRGKVAPSLQDDAAKYRFTIHQLPGRSFKEWIQQLCVILRACGQFDLAESLTGSLSQLAPSTQENQGATAVKTEIQTKEEGSLHKGGLRNGVSAFGSKDAIGFFKRRLFYSKLAITLKRPFRHVLHGLETKCGYFLPYHLSESKNDEFFRAIRDLTRGEDIRAALIIGAALGQGSTEALLAGVSENTSKPSVFCVSMSNQRLRRTASKFSGAKWYNLSPSPRKNIDQELRNTVNQIKAENHIDVFDVVLIDGSELTDGANCIQELYQARLIFLDDTNRTYNQANYELMLRNSDYVLTEQNPGLRNGYAIFEKVSSPVCKVDKTLISSGVLEGYVSPP